MQLAIRNCPLSIYFIHTIFLFLCKLNKKIIFDLFRVDFFCEIVYPMFILNDYK